MSTYVVLKRMYEDRHYMPGEVLVDPDIDVDILMNRGFLQVVPDNYTPPARGSRSSKAEAERPPSYEEAIAAGYSESASRKLSEGIVDDEVNEETDRLAREKDTSGSGEPMTESEIEALVRGLLDNDLDLCLVYYEVETEDDSDREAKERAFVAFLVEHPEIANSDEPLVPNSSDVTHPADPDASKSVGANPPDDNKAGKKKS